MVARAQDNSVLSWEKEPYKTILECAINKRAAVEIVILRRELQNHI